MDILGPKCIATMYQIGASAFVLFIFCGMMRVTYCLYFHPLARFPGPKLAAVSRIPFAAMALNGRSHQWLSQLHARYGPVVRISPGELTTISPGAWKDIYLTRPQLRKDPHSQTPSLKGAHSLFTAHGDTHSRLRRVFTNAFTDLALHKQSTIIEHHADLFVQRLRRESSKKGQTSIDMAKYYGYAALDIISDLTFGESFHGLENDNEHQWIVGIFLGAKFGVLRTSLSYFYPLDRLFGMIFLGLTAKHRKRYYELAENAVGKRLSLGETGNKRSDFLSAVMGRVGEAEGKGLTKTELEVNSLAMVIAGSQLTTVALTTATFLLLTNPATYDRLCKEIRTAFLREKDITITTTTSLPYLSAVINETLRIHHPTPIHLPRLIPPGGMMIDGTWIPGNTVIGMALHQAQTSPQHFHDPLGFHPERFLSPSDSRYDWRYKSDNMGAFRPFSIGNRSCLGSKVFMAEARVILAKTLWSFDLSLPEDADWGWLVQKAYLVFTPKPLFVKISEHTTVPPK
jgi:cytochrome P450